MVFNHALFRIIAGCALLTLGAGKVCRGQAPVRAVRYRHYWFDGGAGPSSLGAGGAGAANLHAELRRQWLVSVGASNDSNVGFLDFAEGEKASMTSYHLLGGKVFAGQAVLATVSTGLGLVRVHRYYDPGGLFVPSRDHTYRTTLGVPLQVQGFVVAFRTLGLGLTGQVNLNTVQTTANLTISLAIGRLPTRRLERVEQRVTAGFK